MNKWLLSGLVMLLSGVASGQAVKAVVAGTLDSQLQSAVAAYQAGHLEQAAAQLEQLLPRTQDSFEVHELLGMVYTALGRDPKAIEQLQIAVHLQPKSSAARTNLAGTLSHAGDRAAAGEQFRKALELEPNEYGANHNLGEFYVQAGQLQDALPLLATAQRIQPTSYNNGYDLAMADFLTDHLDDARKWIRDLAATNNTSELHNLLGRVNEKDGKYVDAANEFETAAQMEPSDDNLFNLGSELLLHRTYEPAITTFRKGTERYPQSPRLWIGLGMALYARGIYEDAIQALLTAADLDPSDARCYLFLFKAYDRSPQQAEAVIERFGRYAELQPNNALAEYYYATVMWKGKRLDGSSIDLKLVEALLLKSIALDPKNPDAHVQLGTLYSDAHAYDKSIAEYQQALQLNPNLPEALYHLGTDYVHTGQKDRAQVEFAASEKLRAQHLAEVDKERAEVEQFIYSSKDVQPAKP